VREPGTPGPVPAPGPGWRPWVASVTPGRGGASARGNGLRLAPNSRRAMGMHGHLAFLLLLLSLRAPGRRFSVRGTLCRSWVGDREEGDGGQDPPGCPRVPGADPRMGRGAGGRLAGFGPGGGITGASPRHYWGISKHRWGTSGTSRGHLWGLPGASLAGWGDTLLFPGTSVRAAGKGGVPLETRARVGAWVQEQGSLSTTGQAVGGAGRVRGRSPGSSTSSA